MQTGALTFVQGLEGAGRFRFEGKTASGRPVAVEVPSTVVTALAEAMRHTNSAGHAAWHVQRENSDFATCAQCKPAVCNACGAAHAPPQAIKQDFGDLIENSNKRIG